MLIITSQSHLDHGLTAAHLSFILRHFADREGFFAETITLPDELRPLECALRGPAVGTRPVLDAEVVLRARGSRTYPSRLLTNTAGTLGWPLLVRQMTVIAGPAGDHPCVLYTAHGGPLAPREPGDPSLSTAEHAESVAFWAEHALVI